MTPDEFDRLLMTTRSVRRNLDLERPVDLADIARCIDVAVQAPTGIDAENWRFMLVTDAAKKQQIQDLYQKSLNDMIGARRVTLKSTQKTLSESIARMPLLIFVCALGRPDPQIPSQVAYFASVLPAAWSLMLSLRARGYGSTWTSLLTREFDAIAELLEMPADVTMTVMLPVAHRAETAVLKPADRRGAEEVSYCNAWGNNLTLEE